jgi:hypothetical protein
MKDGATAAFNDRRRCLASAGSFAHNGNMITTHALPNGAPVNDLRRASVYVATHAHGSQLAGPGEPGAH